MRAFSPAAFAVAALSAAWAPCGRAPDEVAVPSDSGVENAVSLTAAIAVEPAAAATVDVSRTPNEILESPPRAAHELAAGQVRVAGRLLSPEEGQVPHGLTAELSRIIAELEGTEPSVEEDAEARRWHALDVDGDGELDFVAFISLEGQGGRIVNEQKMVLWLTKPSGYRLVGPTAVGKGGVRTVDFERVERSSGRISLRGRQAGPEDPACCPSVPVEITFTLSGSVLAEEK